MTRTANGDVQPHVMLSGRAAGHTHKLYKTDLAIHPLKQAFHIVAHGVGDAYKTDHPSYHVYDQNHYTVKEGHLNLDSDNVINLPSFNTQRHYTIQFDPVDGDDQHDTLKPNQSVFNNILISPAFTNHIDVQYQ